MKQFRNSISPLNTNFKLEYVVAQRQEDAKVTFGKDECHVSNDTSKDIRKVYLPNKLKHLTNKR